MKKVWVVLSSSVLAFVNTMFLTSTKCPTYARVWERQRLWYFWSSEKQEVLVSCFLSSNNLLFFLWLLAMWFFSPWQLFFYFMCSYYSYLQINYKSLSWHDQEPCELSTCSWDTVANSVIFEKWLCALACAFMTKFCDEVRLPAFHVEIWTMHVVALQNADKCRTYSAFQLQVFWQCS